MISLIVVCLLCILSVAVGYEVGYDVGLGIGTARVNRYLEAERHRQSFK